MVSPKMFFRSTMDEILGGLALLPEPQFAALLEEVRSADAFSTSQDRLDGLATKIDLDPEELGYVLGLLEYFYNQIARKARDDASRRSLVAGLANNIELKSGPGDTERQKEQLLERLSLLLAHNDNAERQQKEKRLRTGFVRNGVAFSSFLDLRPNIDAERTGVQSLIPIFQFRITTDMDREQGPIVFQLDEQALGKLRQAVDDAERKLSRVRADVALSSRIVKQ